MGHTFIDIETVIGTEPRIVFIKNMMESLLSVVEVESGGEVVNVDGFRLKDHRDWLIPKSQSPSEILRYLSAMHNCNVSCKFCYNKGNPDDSVFSSNYKVTAEEVWFRLGIWNNPQGKMLYLACLPDYELLNNRIWYDVLSELRKNSEQAFCIFTNGRQLTLEVIDKLDELSPVVLNISLNSIDPEQRKQLMGDPKSDVAIKALPLLKERQIPYTTTVVTWPTSSLETIGETIRYADYHDTTLIDVTLHGYTQHNRPSDDADEMWRSRWVEVVKLVQGLRTTVETPITITPALFEEQLSESRWNECKVLSVIKNSPAYHAGIVAGDVITHAGGFQIRDRAELFKILKFGSLENFNAELIRRRPGMDKSESVMINYEYQYPYFPLTEHNPYGIIINQSISFASLGEIKKCVLDNKAKHVLICTTLLMKDHIEQAIYSSESFAEVDATFHLQVVNSNWMGGNIVIGDLMATDDFIDAIHEFVSANDTAIDLVLIPGSGFGQWKRDLRGKSIKHIQRECGIPIIALKNELIPF